MKITGSVKSLNYQKLFLCTGLVGLVLIALRFYQVLSILDPETGFFTDKNDPTVWLFYILTVVFVLGTLMCFVLAGDRDIGALPVRRSLPHAAGSIIMAAALAREVFAGGFSFAGATKLQLAGAFAAALSVIVFFLDFIVFLTGAAFGAKLRFVRLIPVLWTFFLTVGYFSITASYLHSTQLLLTIFGSAFFMLYLFEYARKLADINAGENTAVFCATGAIAAVLLLAAALPALALKLSAGAEIAHCPFQAFQLTAAVFCVTSLCLLRRPAKEQPVPTVPFAEKPSDETDAEQA